MAATAISLSAGAAHADDLVQKIRATTDTYQRYVDLLDSSSQATRIAALTEMTKSKDTALVDLAIEKGLSSRDDAMLAIAARAAFRQVRSIVARVNAPQPPTAQSQEVVKLCGDGVQYSIDKFNAETGQFEARGQDHVGVGQINGASLSLTIEYGCSLTGVLQPDGTFSGMVSAPYRKGALPAKFAFR
ncbi:MAG: hypothetical protein ABL982_25865 [Vicinamibacterales bacterium]